MPTNPLPQATPIPVQVIGDAGIGTDYLVPSGVKVLLGFLATFHFLLGLPLMLWPIFAVVMNLASGSYFAGGQLLGVAVCFLAGAPNVACGAGMLLRRQRGTWRGIHVVLSVMCGLELVAFMGGATLAVSFKDARGMDSIALALGVFVIVMASLLFWLHAATKLLLLQVNVRRAFLIECDEPVRVQRVGTIVMMSLYGVLLLIGLVVYVIR